MTDILAIKRQLAERAQSVAEYLLPNGVLEGREWCVGSISGEAGHGLSVCVSGGKSGVWADFQANGEGGDLIDLWCLRRGLTLSDALVEIRGWLGIETPKFEKSARVWRRPEPPKCVKPVSAVLAYLTGERGLSREAVAAYRVGENDRTLVFRSFLPDGNLAFVKHLGIDRPNGRKQVRVEADCEPVLFGWQAIDPNAREVVITEGEIDAMTMWDYGHPALSVPFGGGGGQKQQWIESEFDRISRFEVIYLALDVDPAGDEAAEEIANRIGRHRCRRVKLPRKDANECRKSGVAKSEIEACMAAAISLDPPELRRAGEFSADVVNLFWPSGDRAPGYRLPFAKIAERMVFRPGELSIWTGASAEGKSIMLGFACVAWADQGAKVCIASLEMAPKQTLRRMVKQAANTDRPTEPFIRRIMGWFDEWLWMFSVVGKSPIKRMLEIFEYARCRYGCDVFVVDSLMRLGVGSEDYEGQEKAVYEIVTWTIEKNVHTHLVAHSRKSDARYERIPEIEDIKGASEIGSNAFNILSIWRNRKLEDEIRSTAEAIERNDPVATLKIQDLMDRPTVLLNVAKQRNGDFDGKVGLWFDPKTYQYRSAHDPKHGINFVSLGSSEAAA